MCTCLCLCLGVSVCVCMGLWRPKTLHRTRTEHDLLLQVDALQNCLLECHGSRHSAFDIRLTRRPLVPALSSLIGANKWGATVEMNETFLTAATPAATLAAMCDFMCCAPLIHLLYVDVCECLLSRRTHKQQFALLRCHEKVCVCVLSVSVSVIGIVSVSVKQQLIFVNHTLMT